MKCTTFTLLLPVTLASCAYPFDPNKQAAVEQCEEVIKAAIPTPASYKRVDASYMMLGKFTKDDAKDALRDHVQKSEANFANLTELERIYLAQQKKMIAGKEPLPYTEDPARYKSSIVILYDAENAMGATIRRGHLCQLSTSEDKKPTRVFLDTPISRSNAEKEIRADNATK